MKKKLMLTCLLGLALGVGVVACDLEDDTASSAHNFEAAALIVTTDFQTGSYATINLDDHSQVVKNINTIHSDSVCSYDATTGTPFIVARFQGDYVDVLDPEDGFDIVSEYTVEAGTNPQGLELVSDDSAYVTRLGTAEMLVVHPTDGTVKGTIDLSSYADADGNPEAAGMYNLNGKIYVTIQRLAGFEITEYSSILVIDGETGVVEDEIKTTVPNPSPGISDIKYNPFIDRLIIVEVGAYGVLEGGVEMLDPTDNSLSGLVVTEETLGGDISDAVVVSETKGYAIVGIFNGEVSTTSLVSFNPSTGEKLDDVAVSDEWAYSAIELNPDGTELWIGDTTMTNPGIRIFDVATDEELTEEPIDVGLPPFAICFVE